jgi:hypothetical protein
MTQNRQKRGTKSRQGGRQPLTAQDLLNRPSFKAALEVEARVADGASYEDAREEISQARGADKRTLERRKHDGQAFSAMGQPMATWPTLAHVLPGEKNPFLQSKAKGKASETAPRSLNPSRVTSTDIQLLRHIKEILDERGVSKIFSTDLSAALNTKAGAPWATCGPSEKPMTATLLAHMLAKFRVRPKVIRIVAKNARGYSAANFLSAFKRHRLI